jgi:hypothetical protein
MFNFMKQYAVFAMLAAASGGAPEAAMIASASTKLSPR